MAKRKKPFDPAEAERQRAERERNSEMIAAVRSQPSTALNIDQRTGKLVGAWRMNCFNLLLKDKAQGSAVAWLETLIRTANGENSQERRPDFIRSSSEGAPGQNITQAMIAASEELATVEASLYPACARLLFGLLKPDASQEDNWRDVVKTSTGETNPHAQAAMVRAAAANLLWVQDNISRLMRDRRERRMAA